ncbi:MAG: hypothetical protein ACXAD7_28140 [Candidatus Kariarchaeaceae archaeon]
MQEKLEDKILCSIGNSIGNILIDFGVFVIKCVVAISIYEWLVP